MVPTPLF
jgi:hypothetical protein